MSNDKINTSFYYKGALGFSMPPVIPLKNKVFVVSPNDFSFTTDDDAVKITIDELKDLSVDELSSASFITDLRLSLSSEAEGKGFIFPNPPIISLSSKNIITRRYVSKGNKRGSVKERWSEDDWDITINGLLQSDNNFTYTEYLKQLLPYCREKKSISVTCDLLISVFGITRIAIESYDFPFTKGEENQGFSIKAFSDDIHELLIEIEPNV
jgi:hypothetical protein